ncbi:MAG: hypothetical protein JW709_11185 [Sedimentisphaerales bacterium]|nr:hypothetical protein [Sedimentisphaerales bacterium]
MPSESDHINLALRNQQALDTLIAHEQPHSEWITTIAFYKALHLVEAVFARNKQHSHNHEHRENHLKRDRRWSHIWKHYRPLWAASMIARYLQDEHGATYRTFEDFLPPERVQPELLHHRLSQIELSVKKLLSPESRARLDID